MADLPSFDLTLVEADLRRRHEWAEPLKPGTLSLAAILVNPNVNCRDTIHLMNVTIGDVDASLRFLRGYENKPHWNLYMSLNVFRADLPQLKRPKIEDCIGVIGLIADCDTDKGRNLNIPVDWTFELNSSPDNYHRAVIFDRAVSVEGVKPFASALRTATHSDDGTIDVIHLWRIDGTLNWPDWRKVHERGRSREPYPVRITQADYTRRHSMDQLHLELNRIISADRAEPKKAKPKKTQARGARDLYEGLSLTIQTSLRTPPDAEMDRSAVSMAIVKAMIAKGYSSDEMAQVYDRYPSGPFSHYKDREDFQKDVENIRKKAEPTADNRARRILEYLYTKGVEQFTFDDIRKHAEGLQPGDEEGAKLIIAQAIVAGFTDLQVETLTKPLAKALGVRVALARKLWADTVTDIHKAAAPPPPSPEERTRLEQEENERSAREADAERKAERERLWTSCSTIAQAATLLGDMEDLIHRMGMVGEGAAIRSEYLAISSRLNRTRALCLLRRGAAAGGKNYLIDKVLNLIPIDSVVRMSSGSPLSLVYYGGLDEDALKYKVLYIPEAAVLAETPSKVENPQTIMLRLLISEGRIDHHVVVPQGDGPPATVHIKRNGPVAVVITSARDNIEDELLTRLMMSDADESMEQSHAVIADVLTNEDHDCDPPEIERWLDYQRWLEAGAPYDVVIPYRRAILDAYVKRNQALEKQGKKPNIQLRIRRDIHGFHTAIKTSAILYQAQRKKDAEGRIVASLSDYENAYQAFEPGLAGLYQLKTPDTLLAVVKAVEAIGERRQNTNMFDQGEIQVSVSMMMTELGISGRDTAYHRLRAAVGAGYLQMTQEGKGQRAAFYKILKPSAQIEGETGSRTTDDSVFPHPSAIIFSDPHATP